MLEVIRALSINRFSIMSERRPVILALGEVLWDLLPGGRQLGGAPANFAYHAAQLGADARIVSAVGDDELGREILERLKSQGLDTSFITTDQEHATGVVTVTVDMRGQPAYTIHEGVAWDFIPVTPAVLDLATRADCVCFGTLAQRSPVSRATIREVVAAVPDQALRILDINFRQHYYDREVVEQSLAAASVLKINDEELPRLFEVLGSQTRLFTEFTNIRVIATTRGSAGSSLWFKDGTTAKHPGHYAGPVLDTVGAGDAFTAALAMGLLRGCPPAQINDAANRLAAYVCTRAGATPVIPGELLAAMR
jgi:fructokinase